MTHRNGAIETTMVHSEICCTVVTVVGATATIARCATSSRSTWVAAMIVSVELRYRSAAVSSNHTHRAATTSTVATMTGQAITTGTDEVIAPRTARCAGSARDDRRSPRP